MPTPKELRRASLTILDNLRRIHDRMAPDLRYIERVGALTYHPDGSYTHAQELELGHVQVNIEFVRTYQQWAAEQIVYDTHRLLVQELVPYKLRPFPTPLLDHLPHPNPVFVFPEPIPFQGVDGPDHLHALYVHGQIGQRPCSTHDPDRDRLRMVAVGMDPHGAIRPFTDPDFAYAVNSFVLDTPATIFDPAAQIDAITWQVGGAARGVEGQAIQHATSDFVRIGLGLLMYSCMRQADRVRRKTAPAGSARARRAVREGAPEAQVYALGYQDGPDMHRERVSYEALAQSSGGGNGASKRPHPRAGFMGIRRVGPGRADRELVLVRPTYIHRPADQAEHPTLITLN